MTEPGTFTKSEMMIVAAARELAGQHVCFVGVGLPNIAVNLAKRTVAPDLPSPPATSHLTVRASRTDAEPAPAASHARSRTLNSPFTRPSRSSFPTPATAVTTDAPAMAGPCSAPARRSAP